MRVSVVVSNKIAPKAATTEENIPAKTNTIHIQRKPQKNVTA